MPIFNSSLKRFSTSPEGYEEISRLFLNNPKAVGIRIVDLQANSIDKNLASVLHSIYNTYQNQKEDFEGLTIGFLGDFPVHFSRYFTIDYYEWPMVLLFKLCPDEPEVNVFSPGLWEKYLDSFMNNLSKYLYGYDISKQQRDNLFFCMKESLKNISTHANNESYVFVCFDFCPKEQLLKITLADVGEGISNSFERRTGDKINAEKAIKSIFSRNGNGFASGKSKNSLTSIASICSSNGGSLLLVSGVGWGQFKANELSTGSFEMPFRGTIVNLIFRLKLD